MSLRGRLLSAWFAPRCRAIERFMLRPVETQQRQLEYLLGMGARTRYGQSCGMETIHSAEEFSRRVPVTEYDDYAPFIDRARRGESDVVWPGRVRWFARSSGTTDRSKYIPVTPDGLRLGHERGPHDVAALAGHLFPGTAAFDGKLLTLGGSHRVEREGERARTGDLSAILIQNAALWDGWFRTPPRQVALCPDFDRKVEAICRIATRQHVTTFAGVPSWNLRLMERVLEYTGRSHLLEVWPDLSLFVHGGVGFTSYAEPFRRLIPSPDMHYLETYNASEGFFAIGDREGSGDMLLMLDYGVWYEFDDGTQIVPLEGVRTGVDYALLITSCNGLWRYRIGDTLTFTSLAPYRIRITGRTKQYINVFGEELMVSNAEQALLEAASATGAEVTEYTVGPVYMTEHQSGGHEWIVEFAREPSDRVLFARLLDEALQRHNSDYEAKRHSTLDPPVVRSVPQGTFLRWLASEGKVGGQHKVPRLKNDRTLVEAIDALLTPQTDR